MSNILKQNNTFEAKLKMAPFCKWQPFLCLWFGWMNKNVKDNKIDEPKVMNDSGSFLLLLYMFIILAVLITFGKFIKARRRYFVSKLR